MELHCLHWFQFENTQKITLNTEIKKLALNGATLHWFQCNLHWPGNTAFLKQQDLKNATVSNIGPVLTTL